MAKLSNLKRLVKEDFDQKDYALIEKLGISLNPFMEQISNAFNKDIGIENMPREIATIDVENDASGALKIQTQLKHSLKRKILGFNVINSENLTNPATYPTGQPHLSWTISGNIITFKNVTGIQANNKYRLTLEIIS